MKLALILALLTFTACKPKAVNVSTCQAVMSLAKTRTDSALIGTMYTGTDGHTVHQCATLLNTK